MSNFESAIPVVMAHEGTDTNFWVNDPADPGGETVWGWSMLTIQRLGLQPKDLGLNQPTFTPGCLKAVSKKVCQELYRKYFWDKFNFGLINDQTAATKIFDMAVNAGPSRAISMAQKACNTLGQTCAVDGGLGPLTAAAINACDPHTFVRTYADELANYYRAIVKANPTLGKFLSNWLRRSQWGVV